MWLHYSRFFLQDYISTILYHIGYNINDYYHYYTRKGIF